MQFHWLIHDDKEIELGLKGPFWVEISSNEEEGLYELKGHPEQALVHDTVEPS